MPRANQTAGHYVKLISLAGDGSQYKLYLTSLTRAIARCSTAACNALPAGGAGEDRLEKYIADNLLPWAAGDFAPLEAAVIDEDTYVEQGRDLERAYSLQVINFILGTLQPDTDLAMVGYPFTDEVSHQFLGLVSPTDAAKLENGKYVTKPPLPGFVEAQKRAAAAQGCAFWNAFAFMGGKGSVRKWYREGNWEPDLTHPNRAGAAKVADGLIDALLAGYDAFRAARPPVTP